MTDFAALLRSPEPPQLSDAQVAELIETGTPEQIFRLALVAHVSMDSERKLRAAVREIEIRQANSAE